MRLLSVLLLITLLLNACNSIEKEEQPQITDNPIERTEDIENKPTEEVVTEEEVIEEPIEEVQNKPAPKEEIVEVAPEAAPEKVIKKEATQKKEQVVNQKAITSNSIIATGTVKLNTMLLSQTEMDAIAEAERKEDAKVGRMLTLLAAKLSALKEDDGIQGFVDASSTNVVDTLRAATFEDSVLLGSGRMANTTRGGQVKVGAFNEVIAESRSVDEQVLATSGATSYTQLEYMRRPKMLKEYTGYKIELVTVYNKSLPLTDELFKTFGGLSFKDKTGNSTTYYLGEFRTKRALEDYLAKVVAPRFPKAKGVKFEKGKEIEYK